MCYPVALCYPQQARQVRVTLPLWLQSDNVQHELQHRSLINIPRKTPYGNQKGNLRTKLQRNSFLTRMLQMNPSVCVMWQTLLSYVRQSATTEVSTSRRGQQHKPRSAELVNERRPKGRYVLIKSGLKWCWRGVREGARAQSIHHDSIHYKCVLTTHRYE